MAFNVHRRKALPYLAPTRTGFTFSPHGCGARLQLRIEIYFLTFGHFDISFFVRWLAPFEDTRLRISALCLTWHYHGIDRINGNTEHLLNGVFDFDFVRFFIHLEAVGLPLFRKLFRFFRYDRLYQDIFLCHGFVDSGNPSE